MALRLYHVSDIPNIARFDPRLPSRAEVETLGDVVWAVDEEHLQNYLLPRDCPRVTFYALPTSAPEDIDRLLAGTSARFVVAVESAWLPTIREARLYLYEFPTETFRVFDAGAGYYVSSESIVPKGMTTVDDTLSALTDRGVELRAMPSLWKLRDAVVASTLQFSIIRWRNAAPGLAGSSHV
jgi:hypothetical protein